MTQEDQGRRDITVACVQFRPVFGETEANLARMAEMTRKAAASGAEIVVLPELADSGYVFEAEEELRRLAQPIPEGRSARALMALAAELGIHIVSGLCEAAEGGYYNSAFFCGPKGAIGSYRKLHLWDREKLFFRPGNLGLPVFDTPLGRIGMAICYDGWFPEVFRGLAGAGADLACIPTNWVPMPAQPEGTEAMANTLVRAAAHSNGLAIACADRVGIERGQPFLGRSLIVGARGWALAGPASAEDEEILIATLPMGDGKRMRAVSDRNDVFADRRSDVYG